MQASKKLDKSKLDSSIIAELRNFPKLIKALDEYILFANRKLIPELLQLSEVCKKVSPYPKHLTLYRGFGNWAGQEDFSIKGKEINKVYSFTSHDKAISTSTDIDIASAFGSNLITLSINTTEQNCLMIIPELVVLVHELRNLKDIQTQEEVILLPPINIEYTVLKMKSKSFISDWLN